MILDTGPFAGLEGGGYQLITADPPWDFQTFSKKGHVKTPHVHYSCMSLDDIKRLPVSALAAPSCALFLWTTAPHTREAFGVLDAWGFTYKSMMVWAKQSRTGAAWAFGTGYILRGSHEVVLVATRGKPKVVSRSVRSLIVAPLREHSRKPDEARTAFEQLYAGPRLELFARERAPGWTCWGNEVGLFPHSAASSPPSLSEAAA